MTISVTADVKQVTRYLSAAQKKQVPFAVSNTLNQLAFDAARKALPKETENFKGGATAFTRKGFRYTKSSKRKLIAWVEVMPNRAKYMRFQIEGGTRFPNKRAVMVPTKHSKLNAKGNFTKSTREKLFNDRAKYFVGKPKGMASAGEGIWERYGRQSRQGGQRIRMVAAFRNSAQYRPLFPFAETTEGVVFSQDRGFASKFRQNLERALQSAR